MADFSVDQRALEASHTWFDERKFCVRAFLSRALALSAVNRNKNNFLPSVLRPVLRLMMDAGRRKLYDSQLQRAGNEDGLRRRNLEQEQSHFRVPGQRNKAEPSSPMHGARNE